ncbi:MAG: signal recognition particle-docking protein FtsY [Desulfobulbus sp.]|nr:signal recognition particle-docking protein FtsY [Desulfobulbus sp.]
MLAWFKKKFSTQPVASPEAVECEQSAQHPAGEGIAAIASESAVAVAEPAAVLPVNEEIPDEPAVSEEQPPLTAELSFPEPVEPSPLQPLVQPVPEPAESEGLAVQTVAGGDPGGYEAASPLPVAGEAVAEAPAETTEALETAAESPASEGAELESEVERTPVRTQEKPAVKSLFQRLQERLGKTRDALVYRLDRLFLGKKEIDQDLFEQLEEILITSDLGVSTTLELLETARKRIKRDQLSDPQALKAIIREQILAYIKASDQSAELVMPEEGPFVIMVVGVNGVGKTTTIGKLAAKFVRSGQSVLLVAGDTFRAAAINQLKIWGERVGADLVAQNPGTDPSSVVFDGLTYGVAHRHDVIIIDTAGRLHTSVNLMEELKKIKRVIGKKMPGAPHEVMLVLDATTGQNGISQAKLFHQAVGVSGLALTKLDGTAKGGIVANVCRELKIPVRFIGIGEQVDDLRDFDAGEFVEALFTGQKV